MKLSTKAIAAYMAKVSGERRAVAQLLYTGNPRHLDGVPAGLLALVKKEIAGGAK